MELFMYYKFMLLVCFAQETVMQSEMKCYTCNYDLQTDQVSNKKQVGKDHLAPLMKENCAKESNLKNCANGVSTCLVVATEIKFRTTKDIKYLDNGIIKFSHQCGSSDDTDKGCHEFLTISGGYHARCICGNSGCNSQLNDAIPLMANVFQQILLLLCCLSLTFLS